MNEKFKELKNRAFEMTEWENLDYDVIMERFGELIIKECMEWCDAHATINGTAQQVRDSIKNHFGVKV